MKLSLLYGGKYMSQNLFFPIYQQLEKELMELSRFITFDHRQLVVYSTKIADMLLRTVSEIENISKELCKKEKIKFYDSKKHIRNVVYFNDYFLKLEECYGLSSRLVNFIFENCNENIFDIKLSPFRKDLVIKVKGKEKETWSWYNAYNKIKHDRIKNFKQANLENLIYSLSALFLLNIYYLDKVFVEKEEYNFERVIYQIENLSSVFEIDYTLEVSTTKISKQNYEKDLFFNPINYFEIAKNYATYVIYEDIFYKTDGDIVSDKMQQLDANSYIYDKNNQILKKKYNNYELKDHYTKCKLVAKLNKNK